MYSSEPPPHGTHHRRWTTAYVMGWGGGWVAVAERCGQWAGLWASAEGLAFFLWNRFLFIPKRQYFPISRSTWYLICYLICKNPMAWGTGHHRYLIIVYKRWETVFDFLIGEYNSKNMWVGYPIVQPVWDALLSSFVIRIPIPRK